MKKRVEKSATSDTEPKTQSDKERCMIWHGRAAHRGLKKIRNLHKVTALKESFKIPRDVAICETCARSKMRNRIPKQLRSWTIDVLGGVQDVYVK